MAPLVAGVAAFDPKGCGILASFRPARPHPDKIHRYGAKQKGRLVLSRPAQLLS